MCAVLEISPKTYYKYRNKEDPDYYDYLILKEIFDDIEADNTYGYCTNCGAKLTGNYCSVCGTKKD